MLADVINRYISSVRYYFTKWSFAKYILPSVPAHCRGFVKEALKKSKFDETMFIMNCQGKDEQVRWHCSTPKSQIDLLAKEQNACKENATDIGSIISSMFPTEEDISNSKFEFKRSLSVAFTKGVWSSRCAEKGLKAPNIIVVTDSMFSGYRYAVFVLWVHENTVAWSMYPVWWTRDFERQLQNEYPQYDIKITKDATDTTLCATPKKSGYVTSKYGDTIKLSLRKDNFRSVQAMCDGFEQRVKDFQDLYGFEEDEAPAITMYLNSFVGRKDKLN